MLVSFGLMFSIGNTAMFFVAPAMRRDGLKPATRKYLYRARCRSDVNFVPYPRMWHRVIVAKTRNMIGSGNSDIETLISIFIWHDG